MTRGRAVPGLLAGLIVALALGFGGYATTAVGLGKQPITSTVTGAGRPVTTGSTAQPSPVPSAPPSVLVGALATPSAAATTDPPPPKPAAVSAALTPPLASPNLGGQVLAQVSDAVTGQVLFTHNATTAAAPASTAKIATAAAVLATHASTDRITTTVVAGANAGQIVLVGAGDPTLSGAAANQPTAYAGAARLSDLAAALKGIPVTQIVVDGRLFTGPATAPTWLPGDTPTDYAAPITAVTADAGRATPNAFIRSGAPDLAAGAELARLLGLPGATVTRGVAPAHAKVLASVRSATYADLVRQMLLLSDNVIAEFLGRQVAIARHLPASFAGAVAAIRAVLKAQQVDIGAGQSDASGLASSDRISPAALSAVLRLATQQARLRAVIDDLPVADWSGTLSGRFATGPSHTGAGLVRAKTGTLTSVSSLAGVVTTARGRLLIFAFIAPAVGASVAATDAAEAALDAAAAALVAT